MLKAQKQLVELKDDHDIGNHSSRHFKYPDSEFDREVHYLYHGHVICNVNLQNGTFYVDDCGYGKHKSTQIAIGGYRKHFAQTMDEITKPLVYKPISEFPNTCTAEFLNGVFMLGYDIIHDKIIQYLDSDNALAFCTLVYNSFKASKYDKFPMSEYQALVGYVDEHLQEHLDEFIDIC